MNSLTWVQTGDSTLLMDGYIIRGRVTPSPIGPTYAWSIGGGFPTGVEPTREAAQVAVMAHLDALSEPTREIEVEEQAGGRDR